MGTRKPQPTSAAEPEPEHEPDPKAPGPEHEATSAAPDRTAHAAPSAEPADASNESNDTDTGLARRISRELAALSAKYPHSWLSYLADDILQNGEANGGVDAKYRPRGYNEGPRWDK